MARSDGYNTRTRQLILDYLINNRQHAVSASNILEHLEAQGASPNPTTVYRYLDKLAGEQRIMKYVADKGEKAGVQGTRLERVIAFVRLFEARGAQLRSFGRHSGVPRAVSHAAAA